jgi:hypothetical protein
MIEYEINSSNIKYLGIKCDFAKAPWRRFPCNTVRINVSLIARSASESDQRLFALGQLRATYAIAL